MSEAKNVKGFVGKLHVLAVVDGGHGDLALGHVPVVHDVVGEQAWDKLRYICQADSILTFLLQVLDLIGHEVVERMVAALEGLLVREAGLLEQVHHHVCSGELSGRVEVDSGEQHVKLNSCNLLTG